MNKITLNVLGLMIIGAINLIAQNNNKIIYGKLSEGKRAFIKNGKMGFMDEKNKILLEPIFDFDSTRIDQNEKGDGRFIPYFKDGMCMFYQTFTTNPSYEKLLKYGFINNEFKVVIPAIYFNEDFNGMYCDGFPTVFTGGNAVVNKPVKSNNHDDEFIIINKKGETISQPFKYWEGCFAGCLFFPEISEGFCSFIENEKSGYLEAKTGKKIIKNKYSLAGPFSGGIAAVEFDYEYITFINKSGEQITNKRFYTAPMNKDKTKKEKSVNGYYEHWLYGPNLGCMHLGGFKDDKIILRYYDNEGTGPPVISLVDKNGNVLIKKNIDENYGFEPIPITTNDPDFIPYKWEIGKH